MSEPTALRVLFAGTPQFAAVHLQALLDSPHTVVAAYTQPDRRAGRGKKLQASPVKQLAEAHGIPVEQPPSLRDTDAQAVLARYNADVMVVVAYGLILPQAVLDTPTLGCVNVHGSLLPRWRGAAPIQRAVEAGDEESGITIMQMDAGLDTGAMLSKVSCAITPTDSAGDLHDKLAAIGPPLLLETLSDLPRFQADAQAQDDQLATYAHKIEKAEALIDWQLSATALERAVCAFNPFPIAYTEVEGERIKLWRASAVNLPGSPELPGTVLRADRGGILISCGEGALNVEHLQLPGGKALTAEQILNARAAMFAPGTQLGAA